MSVPSKMAIVVEISATCTDNPSACQKSCRSSKAENQWVVKPGGGKVKDASSVVKAYRTITSSGKCRNTSAPIVAAVRPMGALLERIERSQPLCTHQVHRHD